MPIPYKEFCSLNSLPHTSEAAKRRYEEHLRNIDLFDDTIAQPKKRRMPIDKVGQKKPTKQEDVKLAKTVKLGAKLAALRVVETKFCAHCSKEITGIKNKKYCNDSCKQKAKYQRNIGSGNHDDTDTSVLRSD